MKRYIRTSIIIDDMADNKIITINNYEEYRQFYDAYWDYEKASNYHADPSATANFTDAALIDIGKHMNVDEMIDQLGQYSRCSKKDMKERLKSILPVYHYRLSKANPKPIFRSLEENIRALGIRGLRYNIKSSYLQIYYLPDKYKYDIKSPEFMHNADELTRCFESIPAVFGMNARKLQDGYAWDLTWNMNSNDTSPSYIPNIMNISTTPSVTYQVSFVHPPQYMSRAPFRYVDGSHEMYMVTSDSFKNCTDSVESLASKLLSSESADEIHSWDELFQFLDNVPYISNGALIRSVTVKDITQTMNGKSKKIYSRPLPTTSTIEYKE